MFVDCWSNPDLSITYYHQDYLAPIHHKLDTLFTRNMKKKIELYYLISKNENETTYVLSKPVVIIMHEVILLEWMVSHSASIFRF